MSTAYWLSLRVTAVCLFGAAMAAVVPSAAASPTVERVAGLRAKLEIIRDREGVPHVRAGNEDDALFGLGFVHAKDRLWQLEFMRRLGTGRLAEVLGSSALQGDKLFRTLGVTQSAAGTWTRYGARHRELVIAYVNGLNAGLQQQLREANLPIEFQMLQFQPEPWRPEDVLVLAKVLGWSVDSNWTQELLQLQLNQKLGPARAAQLMPDYTSDGPIILPSSRVIAKSGYRTGANKITLPRMNNRLLAGLMRYDREVAARTGMGGQGQGSNNWVLAGQRTTTGNPILASDPHLPSQIPSIFYRVHLTGGQLDAIGTTAAGLPGVLMGHNGRIAWGWTNANADVQDLYLERIFDNGEVEYDGKREPLQIRQEIIKVKSSQDVTLTVRATRHGPLVSDLVAPTGPALALRWAALDTDDDIGVAAYLDANRARNWQEFTDAFRRSKAHPQNLVYADSAGNIGYLMPGTIPKRAAGDGTVPVPGWTPQYEWNGYVAFDELPRAFNPEQGYLASANNKIAGDNYPHKLSNSFASPYRATRVLELLSASSRHSLGDMKEMQADLLAVHARELLPLLTNATSALTSEAERKAVQLLQAWDLRATADSAAAAVFEAWYIQLAESVFADELGEPLWRTYSDQLHKVSMALPATVRADSGWCDETRTPAKENCQAIAISALKLALTRMAGAQETADVAAWQWGNAHRLVFFHQPFDNNPQLAPIFNRSVPSSGDKHTLNVASHPRWTEYEQRHLALYRQIIDLGNFRNSRWMAAPGQSGLLFDKHYDDSIEPWQNMEYRPMLFNASAIDDRATERLVLLP